MPKSRTKITVVMAYYENGGMLDLHLATWASFNPSIKSHFNFIIVDDGSTIDPAEKHIIDIGAPIRLFKALVDIPWHQNGARNLGMHHAEGWCLLTDMDHLLDEANAYSLIRMKVKASRCYKPLRYKAVDGLLYHRHPNTYLIHRDLYWKVGGYNEEFCGYYGTDSTIRAKLIIAGSIYETDEFGLKLYSRGDIADASTVRYGRKGSEYHISANPELAKKRKDVVELLTNPGPVLNFPWEEVKLEFEKGVVDESQYKQSTDLGIVQNSEHWTCPS